MKYFAFLSALVLGLLNTQAGGFGGPPPFTNGSPLLTGVDGTYQASVRGNNLSGVIRFTYSSGVQTTTTATLGGNAWFIFYEGQVFNGTTFAAINNGSLSGVLDESFDFPVTQNWSDSTSNSNTVPAGTISSSSSSSIQVTASSNPAGYFNGTIDNNSPNGAFSGKGELSYVIETDTTDSNSQSNTIDDTASSSSSTSTTTSVVSEKFKVKGVRITFGS